MEGQTGDGERVFQADRYFPEVWALEKK